jgi:hypothetical protein
MPRIHELIFWREASSPGKAKHDAVRVALIAFCTSLLHWPFI